MSKILRRPMFRGGGKVSSYGNGITAPLVPGYQSGGQIGGGIIYGKPMTDGRYGFAKPVLGNLTMPSSGSITTGSKLLSDALLKTKGDVPMIPIDTERKKPILKEDDIIDTSKEIDVSGGYMEEEAPDGTLMTKYENWEDVPKIIKNIPFSKSIFENQKKKKLNAERVDATGKGGGADMSGMTANEIEDLGLSQVEKNLKNQTESPEISAKDAIAQNQELFKELLGSKKARGQDISDMLLRFSGSQGNTVGEKFQNYTRAESAAGPSRNEKISQTAAGLAINDYVAGKRSKEQGELLTKKIDYELDAKNKYLTPQKGDSNTEILRKISTAYKIEPGSNKAIKQLLKFKMPGKKIYGITADPTDKKIAKKLEIGLNIVTHKGAKTIIEKISETDIQVIPFSGI